MMKLDRLISLSLKAYIWLTLLIVFAPILTSFIFSFDANKFAAIPWGGFSTRWYAEAFADPDVAKGFRNTAIVAMASSVLATIIGFTAAYADHRYDFFGKKIYLALAFVPPTIPVIILGLAMLVFQARTGLSGELHSVVIAHVVYSLPFAMALIRLRLSQMNRDLEAAAWNLGASQWRALLEIIIPFTLPAILSALFLTMAVSFDEYAIAWFVSGFNETLPVRILILLQREVSPKVNAIGSLVFIISMTLVMLAQIVFLLRAPGADKAREIQGG